MSIKQRRKLTPQLKFQIIVESLQGHKSQAELARQHDIHPQLIVLWKRQFLSNGPQLFSDRREVRSKDRKVEELEKIIGRQTIEIQFLKKVLGHLG